MGKRAMKRPDIKRMDQAVGSKFSVKWSIISWLISVVIFAAMCIGYTSIMESGGGRVYQVLVLLVGAMVVYRLILIVYNIIKKREEK